MALTIPLFMIEILLATPGIYSGCLKMTIRIGAYPHIFPCGWDTKLFYSLQVIGIGKPNPLFIYILKTFAPAFATIASIFDGDMH
jgi:hypothetical protein